MVGERLRQARHAQRLSLNQVATKADISAATLSRIETDKQGLDVNTLLSLSRVLRISAEDLVATGNDGADHGEELADEITSLSTPDRTRLWRELASRGKRLAGRKQANDYAIRFEELLAHVELLRQEIEAVCQRVKKRK